MLDSARPPRPPLPAPSGDVLARALFEQSPLSTVVYDPSGHVTTGNAAFERLFGLRVVDLPPSYSILEDPQLAAQGLLVHVQRAFAGEAVTLPPARYDAAPEIGVTTSTWTQAHLYPLVDRAGEVAAVVLVHLDLTARMEAEAALRASESRLRVALDAGQLGAWEWSIDAGQVRWSETLERMHGLEAGTFAGTFDAFQADIHPQDRDTVFAAVERTMAGHPHELTYRIIRPDGEVRWLHARGQLLRDADGRPERIVGICTDVTDARRLEEGTRLLAEAGALLATSLDHGATLATTARLTVPTLADFCVVDLLDPSAPNGVRRVAGAHADPSREALLLAMHGFPPRLDADDLVSRTIREATPQMIPVVGDADLAALAAGRVELLALLRDLEPESLLCIPLAARDVVIGTMLLASAGSQRRYGPDDLPVATELARRAALAVDNARLHRASEEARRQAEAANRSKSEFLAAMSHELRTPLNAIGGYTEMLLLGVRGPLADAQRADLERVARSQRHLLGVINDILNFARVEAGFVEYDLRPVRVADVMAEVEPLVGPQLMTAKALDFSCHPGTDGLRVHADREKVRQIILNLLANAVKFTGPGGRVWMSVEAAGQLVMLRVHDTGIGIPADRQASVFEPFVQVHRTLTTPVEGTGLGLAISRDLARGMGGDLTVESVPGVGSTFTLTLARA